MSEPPTPSGSDPDKPWSDPTAEPSPAAPGGRTGAGPPSGGQSRSDEAPSAGQQRPEDHPPPGGYPGTGGHQSGDYPPPGGYQSGGYPPAGGYQPGSYPPPAGSPPPGAYQSGANYGGPPTGYANNEDKTWALVAHFGGAAGMFLGVGTAGWIAPLVAMLAQGNQSPAVRAHAAAALNFQLVWSIVGVVGWTLSCIGIGFLGVAAAMALGTIFGVIAGLRANEGQLYRYPGSPSLVK